MVFKTPDPAAHRELSQDLYQFAAWGETFERQLADYGQLVSACLNRINSVEAFSPADRFLDIGSGSGILIHSLQKLLAPASNAAKVTAIEPSSSLSTWLQRKFPSVNVICDDFESLSPGRLPHDHFDVIFCFGVDYLFRNLAAASQKDVGAGQFGRTSHFFSERFLGHDLLCARSVDPQILRSGRAQQANFNVHVPQTVLRTDRTPL